MPFIRYVHIFVFYCALIHLLYPFYPFSEEHNLMPFEAFFSFKPLFLSNIIEAESIIMLSLLDSSVPIIHILNINYYLSDQLIPSILILPWLGELIHISITTLYLNSNTDKPTLHLYIFIFFWIHMLYHILYHPLWKRYSHTSSEWTFSYVKM